MWWHYRHVYHKYCKKITSTCPCVVPLKHAVAMRKQENMPRECPIPACSATPWDLNIKTHLARCHPTVAPNTVDLTEWVVVSQDDEKQKGRAKKIPMVMKPNITWKVAHAVDNQGACFSEASLGRSAAMGIVTQWAIRLHTSDFFGPSPPTPNPPSPP